MFRVLTDSFSPVEYKSFKFSGGEIQVRITSDSRIKDHLTIEGSIWSADDLFELGLLCDALRRRFPGVDLSLVCPYLPYARQDRVCSEGEALALKVCCNYLNSLSFSIVEVWDVHSDVALALLNNVKNVEQCVFYIKLAKSLSRPPILVCPDSGASKKIYTTSRLLSLPVIKADKIRDPRTGEITGTVVHSDSVGDEDLLVMDDICDGGRTFIELEKKLRPLTTGKVMLYVTHGIFSKGAEVLSCFDKVFVANPHPSCVGKLPDYVEVV